MSTERKVAVLQSSYLPWKGYFDLVHKVDLFIFYDDVQYTKNDWRNRNRIKILSGEYWLTVPVGNQDSKCIDEVVLHDDTWQIKHWKTLKQGYARSPCFGMYKEFFEEFYLGRRWDSLSELNQYLVKHISRDFLGIDVEFASSRDYPVKGKRQERLLDLLELAGATEYYSGPSGENYIDPGSFEARNIALDYIAYDGYPEYKQLSQPFNHHVSVIDLLFMLGEDAPDYIWGRRAG